MRAEEYASTQMQIVTFANLVLDMPLDEFLRAINRADTLGPIFDPTLWIKGQEKMHEVERLARALSGFQSAAIAVLGKRAQVEE